MTNKLPEGLPQRKAQAPPHTSGSRSDCDDRRARQEPTRVCGIIQSGSHRAVQVASAQAAAERLHAHLQSSRRLQSEGVFLRSGRGALLFDSRRRLGVSSVCAASL